MTCPRCSQPTNVPAPALSEPNHAGGDLAPKASAGGAVGAAKVDGALGDDDIAGFLNSLNTSDAQHQTEAIARLERPDVVRDHRDGQLTEDGIVGILSTPPDTPQPHTDPHAANTEPHAGTDAIPSITQRRSVRPSHTLDAKSLQAAWDYKTKCDFVRSIAAREFVAATLVGEAVYRMYRHVLSGGPSDAAMPLANAILVPLAYLALAIPVGVISIITFFLPRRSTAFLMAIGGLILGVTVLLPMFVGLGVCVQRFGLVQTCTAVNFDTWLILLLGWSTVSYGIAVSVNKDECLRPLTNRPKPELVKETKRLLRETRSAKPDSCLSLITLKIKSWKVQLGGEQWKVLLLEGFAVVVDNRNNAQFVDRRDLRVHPADTPDRRGQKEVRFHIGRREFNGTISSEHFERYSAWTRGQGRVT